MDNIRTLNNSAKRKGFAPNSNTGLSQPILIQAKLIRKYK